MSDAKIPQKMPYAMDLEPGTYAWCACGQSAKQPFCDGAHAGTEFRPHVWEQKESGRVALCGCKHKKGEGPMCDGSHSRL